MKVRRNMYDRKRLSISKAAQAEKYTFYSLQVSNYGANFQISKKKLHTVKQEKQQIFHGKNTAD